MDCVEALVVVDPEVVADQEDGGPVDRGGAGGVRRPAVAQGEGVGGDCGHERELWRRRKGSEGEKKVGGERIIGLSWDDEFDLVVGIGFLGSPFSFWD